MRFARHGALMGLGVCVGQLFKFDAGMALIAAVCVLMMIVDQAVEVDAAERGYRNP